MRSHGTKQKENLCAAVSRCRNSLGALLAVTILSACGGGGDSTPIPSPLPPPADTLSGVAAVAYPILNGVIEIKCAGGSQLTTTTNSTGAWQVTISGQTLPCAVQVSGGTINGVANTVPYHSIATSFGTVNVTPLSDLMLAYLLIQRTPNAWFAGLDRTTLPLITQARVNAALATQCAAMSGLTPLCTTNPITTAFASVENMLRALTLAISNSGVAYSDLLIAAATPTYTLPVVGFNTVLTDAYIATTTSISAIAMTTAQNLTVNVAMASFSPLSAMGGARPYIYSITSGTLPTGLSFSTSTGVVSGTPTAIYATVNVVFSVRDANNVVASTTSSVSFTVSAGVGPSGTAAQYFNRKAVGNTWTLLYRNTITPTGGASVTETFRDTYTITSVSNGIATFTHASTEGTPPVTTTNSFVMSIDPTGAWVITENGETEVLLPPTFSVGTTWLSLPATTTHGAENSTVVAFNVTRTVPAGTFTDCLQINVREVDLSGDVFNYSYYYSPTAGWLVDGAHSNSNAGTSYVSTTQLQAGYIANP